MLEVLSEDYIRTARAKGQAEIKVLIRHALRNAAVPIVTVIGLGVALLIGGVVVTESVFTHSRASAASPSMRCWRATIPTIQAVILLFSLVYVLINLLIDLAYTLLRPEDPLLSVEPAIARLGRDRRAAAEAPACWRGSLRDPQRHLRRRRSCCSWSLIGLLAPLLGTVDPSEIDPAFRNRSPASSSTIRNDDGTTAHVHLSDGHRQPRPRRLQPRASTARASR